MKDQTNFTFPSNDTGARGVLGPAVKQLYVSGVHPTEIRARAIAKGWSAAGVNKALRDLGYRERNHRDDLGIKYPLDAAKESERLLSHYSDASDALVFVEEIRRHLVKRL